MIKNIVFDLGNVILMGKPSMILDTMQLDEKQYVDIQNHFFANWNELDLGKVTLEEHFHKCGFESQLNDAIQYQLLHYYAFRPINMELIDLIKRLKQNDYKIYILSNNNKEAMNYLIHLPLLQDIDGWVVSCDYQTIKPSKEIYQILFEKYNLKAEECFFIDDKEENIKTAKLLGMKGYIYDSNTSTILELVDAFEKNNINL